MDGEDPARDDELPRQLRQEMRVLTKEEARRYLEAARQDRLAALFELALGTGMRPGEYMGLRWDDVDLDSGLVVVRRTLSRGAKGDWIFEEPKTPHSRRTIPLPTGTVESRRREQQLEEREAAGDSWKEHGLVWGTHRQR